VYVFVIEVRESVLCYRGEALLVPSPSDPIQASVFVCLLIVIKLELCVFIKVREVCASRHDHDPRVSGVCYQDGLYVLSR